MDSLLACRVSCVGAGAHLIEWDDTFAAGPVDVYAHRRPDASDAVEPSRRGAVGSAEVETPELARPYFRLVPAHGEALVVARRDLPLEGCVNFRDLGGYRTDDGRRVRWGRVFRSGHMANLSEAGKRDFASLAIRAVCDFRMAEERESENADLPGAPALATLGIPPGVGDRQYFHRVFAATRDPADVLEAVHATMRAIIRDAGTRYARMFDVLRAGRDGAVLLNCSAGKERTGIGSALFLTALGVPRDTVRHDFLLSRTYFPALSEVARVREKYGVQAESDDEAAALVMPLLETHASYLDAAFGAIEDTYSSMDDFLARVCGVGPAERRELREIYTC
ncbi:MAG: tyrosine-protein phosphatase [Gammaproteobacteria bacterium]